MERFAVTIEIESDGAGGLSLRVRPVEPGARLDAQCSTVALTLWCESPDTLRGRLENVISGTTSYFQGNATLVTFCEEMGLRVASAPKNRNAEQRQRRKH
jgi:hypothetical protein